MLLRLLSLCAFTIVLANCTKNETPQNLTGAASAIKAIIHPEGMNLVVKDGSQLAFSDSSNYFPLSFQLEDGRIIFSYPVIDSNTVSYGLVKQVRGAVASASAELLNTSDYSFKIGKIDESGLSSVTANERDTTTPPIPTQSVSDSSYRATPAVGSNQRGVAAARQIRPTCSIQFLPANQSSAFLVGDVGTISIRYQDVGSCQTTYMSYKNASTGSDEIRYPSDARSAAFPIPYDSSTGTYDNLSIVPLYTGAPGTYRVHLWDCGQVLCEANYTVAFNPVPPPPAPGCEVVLSQTVAQVNSPVSVTFNALGLLPGHRLEVPDTYTTGWRIATSGETFSYTATQPGNFIFKARIASRDARGNNVYGATCQATLHIVEPGLPNCDIQLQQSAVMVNQTALATYNLVAGPMGQHLPSGYILEVSDGSGGWTTRSVGYSQAITPIVEGSISLEARISKVNSNGNIPVGVCSANLQVNALPPPLCEVRIERDRLMVGESTNVAYSVGDLHGGYVFEVPDGAGGWSPRSVGFNWTFTPTAEGRFSFEARISKGGTQSHRCTAIVEVNPIPAPLCHIELSPAEVMVSNATVVTYNLVAGPNGQQLPSGYVLEVPNGSGGWSSRSVGFSWNFTPTAAGRISFQARIAKTGSNGNTHSSFCEATLQVNPLPAPMAP